MANTNITNFNGILKTVIPAPIDPINSPTFNVIQNAGSEIQNFNLFKIQGRVGIYGIILDNTDIQSIPFFPGSQVIENSEFIQQSVILVNGKFNRAATPAFNPINVGIIGGNSGVHGTRALVGHTLASFNPQSTTSNLPYKINAWGEFGNQRVNLEVFGQLYGNMVNFYVDNIANQSVLGNGASGRAVLLYGQTSKATALMVTGGSNAIAGAQSTYMTCIPFQGTFIYNEIVNIYGQGNSIPGSGTNLTTGTISSLPITTTNTSTEGKTVGTLPLSGISVLDADQSNITHFGLAYYYGNLESSSSIPQFNVIPLAPLFSGFYKFVSGEYFSTATPAISGIVKEVNYIIQYNTLTGGTFTVGNTLTDSTTGFTAKILSDDGIGNVTVGETSTNFTLNNSDNITDGTASAIINSSNGVYTKLLTGYHTGQNISHTTNLTATAVTGTVNVLSPVSIVNTSIVTAFTPGNVPSGKLVKGNRYIINTISGGDSFTSVGASSNTVGVMFTATGNTTWTTSVIKYFEVSGGLVVNGDLTAYFNQWDTIYPFGGSNGGLPWVISIKPYISDISGNAWTSGTVYTSLILGISTQGTFTVSSGGSIPCIISAHKPYKASYKTTVLWTKLSDDANILPS